MRRIDIEKNIRIMQISNIIIEPDGWVWVSTEDGKHEIGLGDIDVDVSIVDKRK